MRTLALVEGTENGVVDDLLIVGEAPNDGIRPNAATPLRIPEAGKPETQTQDVQLVVFRVTNEETIVPPEPEASFGLPGG